MNTKVIAIAGGSGSGKSYLARSLGNFYPKKNILIIEQDSYYKDISHMDYESRCNQNFDHPNAIENYKSRGMKIFKTEILKRKAI